MFDMPEVSPIFNIMFTVVPILVVGGIVFTIVLMFSPKLRGKIMSQQIRATKYMLDDSKEDLEDMYETATSIGISGKKKTLDKNANVMKEISDKEAEINSGAIETMARSIKKGLANTKSIYCKHCGALIDSDSKFCKDCGNKL